MPMIHEYIWANRDRQLLLMQDGAGGHRAKATIKELNRRGIYPIQWPSLSPDLNPIEAVWNWMKDYIQERYRTIHRSYKKLREQVIEAWNSITNEQVIDLIKSMLERCQAVIDANGWHTKY